MRTRSLYELGGSALVAVVIGLATAAAQQPATGLPAGNAKAGQTRFLKIGCYQCHGNEGQGGAAGPRIGRRPMLALPYFISYVRAPRGGMSPHNAHAITRTKR